MSAFRPAGRLLGQWHNVSLGNARQLSFSTPRNGGHGGQTVWQELKKVLYLEAKAVGQSILPIEAEAVVTFKTHLFKKNHFWIFQADSPKFH